MKKKLECSNNIVNVLPTSLDDLGGGSYRLIFSQNYHQDELYESLHKLMTAGTVIEFPLSDLFSTKYPKVIITDMKRRKGKIYIRVKQVEVAHVLNKNDALSPNYYADENGPSDLLTHINQIFSIDQVRGFYKIVIFKYIKRYQKKNGIEDLKKANTYLQRLIKLEEKNKN